MYRNLHNFLFALLLVASANVLAQGKAAAPGDEFTFRFQPPDGTRVTSTYKLQRTRTFEGRAAAKDEADSKSEGVFKRVGTGFEYQQETAAVSMRRNGEVVQDPVLGLLAKIRPTYAIAADGSLKSIKGYGEVSKLLTSTFPPATAAALAPLMSEEAIVSRETAEWNARYADFAGGKFRIGEAFDTEEPQKLASGDTLNYTVRTSFPRWEPCPAGRCVRLEQVYESDASKVAQWATGVAKKVGESVSPKAGELAPTSSKGRITGSLTRLIDPNTMLIYSERIERTITMVMQVPDKGPMPVTMDEVRSYEYSYERGKAAKRG